MILLQSMWILIARFVYQVAGWYIEILDSRLVAVRKWPCVDSGGSHLGQNQLPNFNSHLALTRCVMGISSTDIHQSIVSQCGGRSKPTILYSDAHPQKTYFFLIFTTGFLLCFDP